MDPPSPGAHGNAQFPGVESRCEALALSEGARTHPAGPRGARSRWAESDGWKTAPDGAQQPHRRFFWGFGAVLATVGAKARPTTWLTASGPSVTPRPPGFHHAETPKRGESGGFTARGSPPGAEAAPSRHSGSGGARHTPKAALEQLTLGLVLGAGAVNKVKNPKAKREATGERHRRCIPALAGETPPPRGPPALAVVGHKAPFSFQ